MLTIFGVSSGREIIVTFANHALLAAELESNLVNGGIFVAGIHGLIENDECSAMLVHPVHGGTLELRARVVWVVRNLGSEGVGLAFHGFDDSVEQALREFVGDIASKADGEATASAEELSRRNSASSVHERMRGLNAADQLRLAKTGGQAERTALERIYGKQVWESLLRNPKITVPEIARIARKGTLPRTQVEFIVDNPSWIQAPQIRRALLSNPKLGKDLAIRVLRVTPKAELKLACKQTAYPAAVRDAARSMLGGKDGL